MKSYIVVGLGRFGSAIAEELCELGNEVLAMDTSNELIQKISSKVTTAVCGDARDLDVLRAIGVQDFDCGIVAVGSDLATGVLVTLNLKELGVKTVVCKAQNELQKRALEKIGADQVLIPERETALKLAQRLTSGSVLDFIELSKDYGIAEISVPGDWCGKSFAEMNIRAKYGLNVIAIKREGEVHVSPRADFAVQDGDVLVVLGRDTDLTRVREE